MTDDHQFPRQDQSGSVGTRFAERWSRLEPDERRLLTMAVDAIAAGEFNSSHSWRRFVDAGLELLPALEVDVLSVEEVHQLALGASFNAGSAPGRGASAPSS